MPWLQQKYMMYRDDKDINIHDAQYYCCNAHNNLLFNAFFYQVLGNKAILWVLQMTTQVNCDGSSQGFPIIDKLQSIAYQAADVQQVEVKYVLVVPYTEPSHDIDWNFALEFDNHKGDVFVLALDFSIGSEGAFSPEDFLSKVN